MLQPQASNNTLTRTHQPVIQRRYNLQHMVPLALILAAFCLRALTLTSESLWRDEVDSIRFAFAPLGELLNNLGRNGFNGPLYELLLRGWLTLAGINDFTLRYFSLLCGVALVALVFAFTRRGLGRRTAFIAAWLATISPVLIWYSNEGKMYSLQPALIVLALYALRRAIDRNAVQKEKAPGRLYRLLRNVNGWWVVFVIAVSLGYYVHLLTPLFLPVAIAFFLLWWPRSRYHWRGSLVALALCTLPYLPLAVWQVPTLLAGYTSGHNYYTLDEIIYSLFANWSAGLSIVWIPVLPEETVWLPILLFMGTAVIVFINQIGAQPDRSHALSPIRTLTGVLVWLVLPILLVYAISLRVPIFEPRYLLWSAAALYILCGAGVAWVVQRNRLAGYLVGIALSVASVVGFVSQIIIPIRPDMRGAAQYLATHMQADDMYVFQIPYTRYALEYYLPQFASEWPLDTVPDPSDGLRTIAGLRQRIVDAPYTNAGAMPDDVSADMMPILDNPHRTWFVESETEMWDARNMVRAWFDQHLHLTTRETLRGVTVSLYEKP